ncbi:toll/interleukin-1 receptor domain-containing protein [Mesorhizobium sp. YIM 152430]|uniref:toll/interleukin-1 receptor domain-containing protein n=1 Tax=Mesorhizobium sp. YIM 152430 TaxID=3031761 RepID=UPI0023D9C850|nr:toll/interleukin-1 receptor domain-containing protein [Mesorhizobium sp. YIM 152430]MDF1600209.1 toll/interleukin-1 receptor domain-containing protein [Mesorhizobium sp. YIM 152430]
MAFAQSTLLSEASRTVLRKSIDEAVRQGSPTAFLSHSHRDALLAKGLQARLSRLDWDVYIDWEDTAMPDRPSVVTAERIRRKIVQLDLFLFLATQNSMTSRWCPWELGYADGKKPNSSILIVQTSDSSGTYGSEYLELYRHLDEASGGGVAHFDKSGNGRMLRGTARP